MTPTMFQVHVTIMGPLLVSMIVVGHRYLTKREMDPLEAMMEWYKVMVTMFLLMVGMSLGRLVMALTEGFFMAVGLKHG